MKYILIFGDQPPLLLVKHKGILSPSQMTQLNIWWPSCCAWRKDEALEAYKKFEAWATTQHHCTTIKVLQSDWGGEYLSEAFNQHLAQAGTVRKLTTHDMPQLNSITEHLNCTLLEHICAFTHSSGLPKLLWCEALRHATWLKNQMAMCFLNGKTPFKALYGRPPNLSALHT